MQPRRRRRIQTKSALSFPFIEGGRMKVATATNGTTSSGKFFSQLPLTPFSSPFSSTSSTSSSSSVAAATCLLVPTLISVPEATTLHVEGQQACSPFLPGFFTAADFDNNYVSRKSISTLLPTDREALASLSLLRAAPIIQDATSFSFSPSYSPHQNGDYGLDSDYSLLGGALSSSSSSSLSSSMLSSSHSSSLSYMFPSCRPIDANSSTPSTTPPLPSPNQDNDDSGLNLQCAENQNIETLIVTDLISLHANDSLKHLEIRGFIAGSLSDDLKDRITSDVIAHFQSMTIANATQSTEEKSALAYDKIRKCALYMSKEQLAALKETETKNLIKNIIREIKDRPLFKESLYDEGICGARRIPSALCDDDCAISIMQSLPGDVPQINHTKYDPKIIEAKFYNHDSVNLQHMPLICLVAFHDMILNYMPSSHNILLKNTSKKRFFSAPKRLWLKKGEYILFHPLFVQSESEYTGSFTRMQIYMDSPLISREIDASFNYPSLYKNSATTATDVIMYREKNGIAELNQDIQDRKRKLAAIRSESLDQYCGVNNASRSEKVAFRNKLY